MSEVTFIGLGIMGYPMAGHLQKAGHKVTVYNRTTAKAEKWTKEFGGSFMPTPSEAAKNADFVFICVGNDDDLRSVTLGKDGVFQTMKKGSVCADHTTASANVARELSAASEKCGVYFLDAPVSGGQAGAEKGALTIMVGGDAGAYAKAEPVIKPYTKAIQYMGPSGAGQLTKMVNQICIVGVLEGLAEAMNFAKAADLDLSKVFAAISKGGAASWQMENRWGTMADGKFDFGFAVDLMRKDLGICLSEAKNNKAPLPVTAVIDQFYADLQNQGNNRLDTSSLVLRFGQIKKS